MGKEHAKSLYLEETVQMPGMPGWNKNCSNKSIRDGISSDKEGKEGYDGHYKIPPKCKYVRL